MPAPADKKVPDALRLPAVAITIEDRHAERSPYSPHTSKSVAAMATTLSPVGTPETPTMAKAKKSKGSTDNSVKKRKREEHLVDGAAADDGRSAKKSKKESKMRKSGDVEGARPASRQGHGAERRPSAEVEGTADGAGSTQPKKAKKDRRSAIIDADAPSAQPGASRTSQPATTGAEATDPEQRLIEATPWTSVTSTLYLALSPCANEFPLEGLIAEHISPLLLQYYPPLRGVVMSFQNARLSESPPDGKGADDAGSDIVLSKAVNEYAVTFTYLTAEFLLFRPRKGAWLEGYVSLQNPSLLGLLCYNYFNAAIERSQLPKDWRWVEDPTDFGVTSTKQGKDGGGYWVDGDGQKVDGRLIFKVRDLEVAAAEGGGGSISIIGTMLADGEKGAAEPSSSSAAVRKRK